jgi:hypothetical protein
LNITTSSRTGTRMTSNSTSRNTMAS